MKVVVCLKQVPVLEKGVTIVDNRLVGEGLSFRLNEFDEYALEEALLIKDKVKAEVTAVTCGPEGAKEVLYIALAKGVDKALQIIDEENQNRNPIITAEILAGVISKLEPSLVFTGVQSEDFGFGQVGILLAEHMGLSHVSSATDIQLDASLKKAVVTKEIGPRTIALVEINLPCVLTVQTSKKRPRYATVLNLLKARRRGIEILKASEVRSSKYEDLPVRDFAQTSGRKVQLIEGDHETAAGKFVELLAEKGLL